MFRWVLKAAAEEGYLDTEAIFVDGTHIKANANLKKQAKKTVPKEAKRYARELFDEVNRDREMHDKKPLPEGNSEQNPPEEKEVVVSTTDPENGLFHKGEHKKCFAYEAHTACDKHNFVLGVHVTPGNVHDSTTFDSLYDELYPEHQTVVADSACKTPWICKRIFESGRVLSTSYTRPKTKENGFPWWMYVYDEYFDDILCPQYQALHLCHNKPGRLQGIQEPFLSVQKLPHEGEVYRECKMREDGDTPYLAGLCRNGRGRQAHGKVQRIIPPAKREN